MTALCVQTRDVYEVAVKERVPQSTTYLTRSKFLLGLTLNHKFEFEKSILWVIHN